VRIGVIADIHGHAEALRAVLEALSPLVDRIVCLGDVAEAGDGAEARGAESCVAELRARNVSAVIGRHDERLLAGGHPGLSPEAAAWLGALPHERTVEGLHLVHDNPIERPRLARGMWQRGTYVRHLLAAQVVFEEAALFRRERGAVVAFGHTHLPAAYAPDAEVPLAEGHPAWLRPGRPYLVNPGAVGYSSDGRSAHAGIWDPQAREFTVIRVETPTRLQAEYRGV